MHGKKKLGSNKKHDFNVDEINSLSTYSLVLSFLKRRIGHKYLRAFSSKVNNNRNNNNTHSDKN